MTTRRNSKSIIRNDSALGSFFRSTSGNFQAQYLGNFFKIALPITLFFTFHAGPGYADPKGGVVTAGEGNISVPNETTTQVNQISQNLIVNWESFNVDANEVVEFNQPNTSAQALNRIFDQNPSQILGTITAQGKVLLVNPNARRSGQHHAATSQFRCMKRKGNADQQISKSSVGPAQPTGRAKFRPPVPLLE
jgi:filamentous hemagglutinin family protein